MMLLLVAGAAALVGPGARPPCAVVCRGAAYDYCVQALGCTAAEATKAEGRLFPHMAERMTRAQAEERCGWLRSRLDLSDAELKKVMMRLPQVLGLSVEATLEPKLDWLQDRLDLDAAQLKKMVLRLPAVLSYSVEDNFSPRLDWLQMRLDLDDAGLRMMVLGKPAVLGYSIEDNMEPKLDWLQLRLDLNETELKKVIVTFPSLFSISVEGNMEPKLGFFEQELGLSPSEVRASIVSAPARLGYSLKTRYRPRLEVCRAAGVDASLVLCYATNVDERFCKRVGVPLEALRAAQEKRPPGYRRPLCSKEADITVAVAPCAPAVFLVPPRPRRRAAAPPRRALKGDSTITVLHQFESVVLDPALAADGNFWIYALVVVEQGGFPLNVLGDPEASATDLLMGGGADETDAYDYEGVVFEATPVDAPPGKAAAFVVADATFAAMPEAAWRRFGTVIAVGGDTDYGDEDAGLIAVSSMGELRALTICSYASLNKRA
jgi:hypothetical protein